MAQQATTDDGTAPNHEGIPHCLEAAEFKDTGKRVTFPNKGAVGHVMACPCGASVYELHDADTGEYRSIVARDHPNR